MRNALIDLSKNARAELESTRAFAFLTTSREVTNNVRLIMSEHERKQKQLEIELLKMKIGTLELEKTLLEGKVTWLEIELDFNEDFSGEPL
jgi:hypothetical protein